MKDAARSSHHEVDWQHVYQAEAPRLRRVIARRVAPDAVDDVLQETFLRAFRSRGSLDPDRPVGPWLTTIAVRAAIDSRRVAGEPLRDDVVDPALDVHDAMQATARRGALESALGSLRPRHRRLLESVAIEGASQVELARREGLAPEAVRAAVLRARRRFEAAFERFSREAGLAGVTWVRPALARLRARWARCEPVALAGSEALLALASLAVMATGIAAVGPTAPNDLALRDPAMPERGRPTAAAGLNAPGDETHSGHRVAFTVAVPRALAGRGVSAAATIAVDSPSDTLLETEAIGMSAVLSDDGRDRRFRADQSTPRPVELSQTGRVELYCGTGVVAGVACLAVDTVGPWLKAVGTATRP